jgi:hypothetical protein
MKHAAGAFLKKVKMIQRAARKVIYCRRARIDLLLVSWDKLEAGYIKVRCEVK